MGVRSDYYKSSTIQYFVRGKHDQRYNRININVNYPSGDFVKVDQIIVYDYQDKQIPIYSPSIVQNRDEQSVHINSHEDIIEVLLTREERINKIKVVLATERENINVAANMNFKLFNNTSSYFHYFVNHMWPFRGHGWTNNTKLSLLETGSAR